MRKAVLIPLLILSLMLYAAVSYGQTPPAAVPPKWDTPEQSQASALAIPNPEPMPKTVLSVIQCNKLVGLIVVDDTGELHPYNFSTKEQVQQIQGLVPADHDLAITVPCKNDLGI